MKKTVILFFILFFCVSFAYSADYTSSQDGSWNADATWGGGGHPTNAGDTATIGHEVEYNVNVATEWGAITINNGGILYFDVDATTSCYVAANVTINSGGELRLGNSGAPIQTGNTATLVLACASGGQYGILVENGGTLTSYGEVKTHRTVTEDAITGGVTTSFDVTTHTGWAASDDIILAPTIQYNTAGYNKVDEEAIQGLVGDTLTMTGTVTYDHASGAEICNLTRNVIIKSKTDGQNGYVWAKNGSTLNCTYTRFESIGHGATNKWGIHTDSGSTSTLTGCVVTLSDHSGVYDDDDGTEIVDCVFYNQYVYGYFGSDSNNTNTIITDSTFAYVTHANGQGLTRINDGTISGAHVYANASGVTSGDNTAYSDCEIYGNTNYALYSMDNATIDDSTLADTKYTVYTCTNLVFDNCTITGNSSVSTSYALHTIKGGKFKNGTIEDVYVALFRLQGFEVVNSDIGIATANIYDLSVTAGQYQFKIVNCNFDITKITGRTSMVDKLDYIEIESYNETGYDDRGLYRYGTTKLQTGTVRTGTYALEIEPRSSGNWFEYKTSIAVTAYSAVTANLYSKRTDETVSVTAELDGRGISSTDSMGAGETDWTLLSLTGTPTTTGMVDLVLKIKGATSKYAWFDDFEVVQKETDTGTMSYWGKGHMARVMFDTNLTAQEVWEYATRRVSDATNITSDGSTIDQTQLAHLDVDISSRSDFEVLTDEVDICAVKGGAVSGVNDFKATGFSVAGDEMALEDDAITSAKYDESTAYPVKADDSGSTYIARTGADSDTLEILSDEIAGLSSTLGTPVALDGAAATVGGMLTKMADDNGGADFDATNDSLTEIAAGGGSDVNVVTIEGVDATDALESACDTAVTGNTVIGLVDTGVDNVEAKLPAGTISDFDESSDEVDIGAVKGVAVASVDDFKADVTGTLTANVTQIESSDATDVLESSCDTAITGNSLIKKIKAKVGFVSKEF